jgi:hypothetical protein
MVAARYMPGFGFDLNDFAAVYPQRTKDQGAA